MIQIKIFSGLQSNSSLDLAVNTEFSLGNDFSCDVFLDINSDSQYQFDAIITLNNLPDDQLSYDDLLPNNPTMYQLKFTNLLGDLYLTNGEKLLQQQKYQLPLFFICQDLKFAIGKTEDIVTWVDPASNKLNDTQKELAQSESSLESDASLDSTGSLGLAANELDDEFIDIAYDKSSIDTTDKNNLHKILKKIKVQQIINFLSDKIKSFYKNYKLYFYIIISVILIGIITLVVVLPMLNKQEAVSIKTNNVNLVNSQIKNIFLQLPVKYSNLSLQSVTNGYQISGLVVNTAEIEEIKKYFTNYSKYIDFKLTSFNMIEQKIRTILTRMNLGQLKIIFDTENRAISLTGLVDGNLTQLNDLEIEINNTIPNLGSLDVSQVYDLSQLKKDLEVATSDIKNSLDFKYNLPNMTIIIDGFLTASSLLVLQQKINQLRQKYSANLNIVINVKDALKALPFKIYSIYTGDAAYIVTSDGRHVFQGGDIDGFKLAVINDNRLLFTGRYTIEVPLTQVGNTGNDTYGNFTNNKSNSINSWEDDIVNISKNIKNNSLDNNTRQKVLTTELNSLQDSITKEQDQLKILSDKLANTNDLELKRFLSEQIKNLQDDIEIKKHELDNYYNTNHVNK